MFSLISGNATREGALLMAASMALTAESSAVSANWPEEFVDLPGKSTISAGVTGQAWPEDWVSQRISGMLTNCGEGRHPARCQKG